MEGFKANVPNPQPIRHTREFDKEELAKALIFYLNRNGVQVPAGKTFIWGLENSDYGEDEKVTLVIDEFQIK